MIDFLKRLFDRLPIPLEKRIAFNLPNAITVLRLTVIPVLFLLLRDSGPTESLIIALLFIIAAFMDVLDGYIARRYQVETVIGKFLDPVADKLILNTAMILMIAIHRIPAWIVAVIIMRDFVVDGIRSIASSKGLIMQASSLAKQKTLCQNFAVAALMIHYPFLGADAHIVGLSVLYLALILSVISGFLYVKQFYSSIINIDDHRSSD
jgi:CDP-diacylglycerol--glycerol-3-phosphate 3-phosphatidyltransferase